MPSHQYFRTNRNCRRAKRGRCKKWIRRRKERNSWRRLKGSAKTKTTSCSVIPTVWTSACWMPCLHYSIRYSSHTSRWASESRCTAADQTWKKRNSSKYLWIYNIWRYFRVFCIYISDVRDIHLACVLEWRRRRRQNWFSYHSDRYGRFR